MAKRRDWIKINSDDWYPLRQRNQGLRCCDCGLVHEMDFRVTKTGKNRVKLEFRVRRNERRTAAARRALHIKVTG